MEISVEHGEHFTLMRTLTHSMDKTSVDLLAEHVSELDDSVSGKYIIINLENVDACRVEAVRELIALGKTLADKDGLLIISDLKEKFRRLFEKADIVFVPSDVEAQDYVFMDQLEKQFNTEE